MNIFTGTWVKLFLFKEQSDKGASCGRLITVFECAGDYQSKTEEAQARGNMFPLASRNISLFNHGGTFGS